MINPLSETLHSHQGTYSKVQMCQIWRLIRWKSSQECQNVTIEFCFIMRIFYELWYTVIIEIVWTLYLKSVPAKFQKHLQHISWVISWTSSSNCRATLVIPPGTSVVTIVTICCNHRDGEYFLPRITRKLGSTATSTVITRLIPLTNNISGAENETQRALLGHTNGNIEMRSPSAAAMLTMVTAATIVWFPPVLGCNRLGLPSIPDSHTQVQIIAPSALSE